MTPRLPSRGPFSGLPSRFLAVILYGCFVTPAPAQDLATLAKQERARRTKVGRSTKTYSDGNGGAAANSGAVPKGSSPQPTPPAQTAPALAPDEQKPVWKARANEAHLAVQRAEATIEVIEIQIAWERPGVKPMSEAEIRDPLLRQKQEARIRDLIAKRAPMELVLADAKRALETFEQEARANGVPPDWLR